MKKKLLIIVSSLFLICSILSSLFYLAVISGAIFDLIPNPVEPEITYGEFSIKLTYELNKEIKIIEDVVVCEFDGIKKSGSAGKSRIWKTYLKSGLDKHVEMYNKTGTVWVTLLDVRQENDFDDLGNKILELYFFGGNGHYYMSDKLGGHDRNSQNFDYISYLYQMPDGTIGRGSLTTNYVYEKYKIRLINWESSRPIENHFIE